MRGAARAGRRRGTAKGSRRAPGRRHLHDRRLPRTLERVPANDSLAARTHLARGGRPSPDRGDRDRRGEGDRALRHTRTAGRGVHHRDPRPAPALHRGPHREAEGRAAAAGSRQRLRRRLGDAGGDLTGAGRSARGDRLLDEPDRKPR